MFNIKTKSLSLYIYAVQIIGAAFYAVFSAAYILSIPTTKVLSGEAIFKVPLTVFGVLFIVLILVSLVIAATNKKSISTQ